MDWKVKDVSKQEVTNSKREKPLSNKEGSMHANNPRSFMGPTFGPGPNSWDASQSPATDFNWVQHHQQDIGRALAQTQQWGKFAKIWDRNAQQANTSYFGTDPSQVGQVQQYIRSYLRRYPTAASENIWFDAVNQKCFSNAQVYSSGLDPIEHAFCTTPHNFIGQTWSSLAGEMGRMVEDLSAAYCSVGLRPNEFGISPEVINSGKACGDMCTPDIRLGVCPAVNKMTNQDSVLIIGGGPSTNVVDFSKFADVPVWTMNNYYKNPLFKQFNNIQLATFLDEVDVYNNDALWECVNDNETVVLQEITDYGIERIKYIREEATYSSYFHTRYRSKLGVGARLLVTAIILGIKNIYFCGFDGYDPNSGANHAFQEGKELPNWMKNSPTGTQERQFIMLWDYILNHLKFKRRFRLIDLSAGQPTLQYKFLEHVIR